MEYTINEIKDIVAKAKTAANKASREYLDVTLKGEDNYPCGFANRCFCNVPKLLNIV